MTRDGRLVVAREHRHDPKIARRQLTDAEHSAALRTWLDDGATQLGAEGRWLAVDPSAESFQVQLHRDGARGLVDADNSVLDGIRLVASLIACGRLVVHRSCAGLLREIPGYVWDDKAAERGEDKPIKANDHSLDALRYVTLTTREMWQRDVPIAPWTP